MDSKFRKLKTVASFAIFIGVAFATGQSAVAQKAKDTQATQAPQAAQPINAKIVNTEAEPVPVTGVVRVGNQNDSPLPVTGTVSVSNAGNSPLLVRDVDNAARQPFRVNLFPQVLAGSQHGTASFQLPAGRMLVIEYVSGIANTRSDLDLDYLLVGDNGAFGHFLFLTKTSITSDQVSTPLHMAAFGSLHVDLQRHATEGSANAIFVISGWLVDAP
jgi:hypothetical protein